MLQLAELVSNPVTALSSNHFARGYISPRILTSDSPMTICTVEHSGQCNLYNQYVQGIYNIITSTLARKWMDFKLNIDVFKTSEP